MSNTTESLAPKEGERTPNDRRIFFAGYSIDSITGLFLSRFETTVKTKTQELTGEKSKS